MYRQRNEAWTAKIETTSHEVEANGDPKLAEILDHYRETYRGMSREYRAFEAEKHLRPSLALGR